MDLLSLFQVTYLWNHISFITYLFGFEGFLIEGNDRNQQSYSVNISEDILLIHYTFTNPPSDTIWEEFSIFWLFQ